MNREELLTAAAEDWEDWSDEHADDVAWSADDAAESGPDYGEHHADVSAPADIDDVLNQRLADMIAELDDDAEDHEHPHDDEAGDGDDGA